MCPLRQARTARTWPLMHRQRRLDVGRSCRRALLLVNIWQIPCALAPNYQTLIGFRFFGGLSSAGGSVTLGMIADLCGTPLIVNILVS